MDDFSPQTPVVVTFNSNSVVGSTVCATYTIIGDNFREEDESFVVLVTPVNGVDLITGADQVSVTIEDDGDCEFQLYVSKYISTFLS